MNERQRLLLKEIRDFRLLPEGYNGDAENKKIIFGDTKPRTHITGTIVINAGNMSPSQCIEFLTNGEEKTATEPEPFPSSIQPATGDSC